MPPALPEVCDSANVPAEVWATGDTVVLKAIIKHNGDAHPTVVNGTVTITLV